jgi:GT2 family glycosyltransferase
MKITIGVPVMNFHQETRDFLNLIQKNTSQIDEIIIVDNGSQPEISTVLSDIDNTLTNKIKIIRHEKNTGVRPALNNIWKNATSDIVVITHNDTEFREKGWDDKIRQAFEEHEEAGIIGAYGAKRIGTEDIYKTPYQMQQLARGGNVSNCEMDMEVHGFRNLEHEFENVAVFDGFFMAIKKELLDKTQGFSDILPQHHNMDNLICIQSLEYGYENIVIPLNIFHRGGMTDVGQNWAEGFGKTKQEIHTEAHVPLYEYGRGKLPILVEDILSEDYKVCGYCLYMDHQLIKEKIYE